MIASQQSGSKLPGMFCYASIDVSGQLAYAIRGREVGWLVGSHCFTSTLE